MLCVPVVCVSGCHHHKDVSSRWWWGLLWERGKGKRRRGEDEREELFWEAVILWCGHVSLLWLKTGCALTLRYKHSAWECVCVCTSVFLFQITLCLWICSFVLLCKCAVCLGVTHLNSHLSVSVLGLCHSDLPAVCPASRPLWLQAFAGLAMTSTPEHDSSSLTHTTTKKSYPSISLEKKYWA